MKITKIWHPWWRWECYKAGFYNTVAPQDRSDYWCKEQYCLFLRDSSRFEKAIKRVFNEWSHSCEHFLTNTSMNRIAWLGQASMCIETGIPSIFRGGFKLLTEEEQKKANSLAEKYLIRWVNEHKKNKKIY